MSNDAIHVKENRNDAKIPRKDSGKESKKQAKPDAGFGKMLDRKLGMANSVSTTN
jgi:hypothetical protein